MNTLFAFFPSTKKKNKMVSKIIAGSSTIFGSTFILNHFYTVPPRYNSHFYNDQFVIPMTF